MKHSFKVRNELFQGIIKELLDLSMDQLSDMFAATGEPLTDAARDFIQRHKAAIDPAP